jgi:hypothetical protein
MTQASGTVLIVEDLGAGRKRFVGVLEETKLQVTYFRNGAYANSARGIHPHTIVSKIDT